MGALSKYLASALVAACAACSGGEFSSGSDASVDASPDASASGGSTGASGAANGGGTSTAGSGGGGAISSDASTDGSSSTDGSAGDCEQARRQYMTALERARRCDDSIDTDQCTETLPGPCACPTPVNPSSTGYADAVQLGEELVALGCTIPDCGQPCPSGSAMVCVPGQTTWATCGWQ
jgi:hypothetical protein